MVPSSPCRPMWPCKGTHVGQGTPKTRPQFHQNKTIGNPKGDGLTPVTHCREGKGCPPFPNTLHPPYRWAWGSAGVCYPMARPLLWGCPHATAGACLVPGCVRTTKPGILMGRTPLGDSRCFLKKMESSLLQYLMREGDVVLGEARLELLAVL